MMEAAVRVAGGEDGRTDEDEGKEGLSLDFGYASSHRYHLQRDKLLRSDVFPFRIALSSPATDAATASDGRAAGSPPSARGTFASPPNSGIGVGTTVISTHGGSPDSYGTPRALRPLVPPFNSPGLGGDATLLLCSPFTAAQWQELHRQALIYKCIMASTPVPPELLFSPRPFPDGPPLYSNYGAVGRGGDYLNLRFTSARGDREPGRCRRTDGKKWRCSRDVAPGQKYCERHVHRARPRSRKPVEPDGRAGPVAAANAAEAVSTTPRGMSHGTLTTTDGPSSAAARPPCTESSPGVLPGDPDVKFPFQFMVPQDKKLRTLGSSGRGGAEVQAATQQWELLHSKMGTSDLQQRRQQYEDDQLNLNWNHGCPFASADISSLEDLPEPHDQRDTPRRFIDAWSRPENPLHGVTIRDNHKSTNSGDGGSSLRSLGNLSPSNLTLSMSGTGGGEDQDHFPVGLRAAVADSGRMLAPSWMSPSSPIGGPLAEVLQTSSTASFRTGRPGGENDGAGLIDLMNKASCESSEGTSPRDGKVRGFSSPTRVLQKAFVSLSDSSSNSSPTLRPGLGPDSGLQWASPSN